MKKKLIAGIIMTVMLPFVASAATTEELQAQINALLAQLASVNNSQTTSCNYTFSKTLKEGVYDTEVMQLQKLLNSDSYTQVVSFGPGSNGNETMYFGPATKAAVMRFQQKYASEVLYSQGISNPTGFVGYATIAKLNSLCKAEQAETTGSNTGGLTSGSNSNSSDLTGGAGYLTINQYTSDVEDSITTGGKETVLSFKARAEGSDIRLTHMRVEIDKTGSTGSNYPDRYFRSFDVYADNVKVGNVSVDDFNRDSSGHYSTTVRLTDAVIKMGSSHQVIFSIKANAVDYIDSDNAGGTWKMIVSNMRYYDATGAPLVDGSSITDSSFYVDKLSTSSDVKVRVSSGGSNPDERNVFVSDSSSGDKVTMNEFRIKAEGTKVAFDTLKVRYSVSGITNVLSDKTTEFQLLRNDEIIDTIDPTSADENDTVNKVLTFNIDDQQFISQDDTATFKIVARMKKIGTSNFAIGDSITISVESASSLKVINAEDRGGDMISTSRFTGSSTGQPQTFRATGINLEKYNSYAEAVPRADSANGYGKYSMTLRITASGDDLWIPLTSYRGATSTVGIAYQMEDGTGAAVSTGTANAVVTRVSGGTMDGTFVRIADGESAQIKINLSYDPASNGFARLQVLSVGYTMDPLASTSSYSAITATPSTSFETDSVDIRK